VVRSDGSQHPRLALQVHNDGTVVVHDFRPQQAWEGSVVKIAEKSPVVPCGFGVDFDVLRFGNSPLLCPQMAFDELLGSRCEIGWRVSDGEIETSRSLRGHYTILHIYGNI
jgi:hypothetical protein